MCAFSKNSNNNNRMNSMNSFAERFVKHTKNVSQVKRLSYCLAQLLFLVNLVMGRNQTQLQFHQVQTGLFDGNQLF